MPFPDMQITHILKSAIKNFSQFPQSSEWTLNRGDIDGA